MKERVVASHLQSIYCIIRYSRYARIALLHTDYKHRAPQTQSSISPFSKSYNEPWTIIFGQQHSLTLKQKTQHQSTEASIPTPPPPSAITDVKPSTKPCEEAQPLIPWDHASASAPSPQLDKLLPLSIVATRKLSRVLTLLRLGWIL